MPDETDSHQLSEAKQQLFWGIDWLAIADFGSVRPSWWACDTTNTYCFSYVRERVPMRDAL